MKQKDLYRWEVEGNMEVKEEDLTEHQKDLLDQGWSLIRVESIRVGDILLNDDDGSDWTVTRVHMKRTLVVNNKKQQRTVNYAAGSMLFVKAGKEIPVKERKKALKSLLEMKDT